MMPDLRELLKPEHTAVVTSEVQRGVVGPDSILPELAKAAEGMVDNVAAILRGARTAGAAVVHCTATRRPDGKGSNRNARLFMAVKGSPLAPTVLPELGPEDSDVVLTRYHGLSPMGNTDLDAVLRNLGVTTIVATGVSV
ncbi:MAG: isochorismatase family protein, partial [Actinobacteria bacterium]|nr:isochorismatase family protein [Actinomycetota bacterium]